MRIKLDFSEWTDDSYGIYNEHGTVELELHADGRVTWNRMVSQQGYIIKDREFE